MANPSSVVFKTAKPTPAQQTQIAAAKPKPSLSARARNILATDPQYGGAGDPLAQLRMRTIAPSGPVQTGAHGLVSSPIHDAIAALAKRAGKLTFNVHPKNGVTVTHDSARTAPAAPAAPTQAATAMTPAASPATPAKTKPAHAKTVTRTPAAATAPAAGPSVAAPDDGATARSVISTILAPVIQQIRDTAAQRSSEGQQAIGGYTTNAENQLKGLDFSTPYAGAAAGENAINTALLARLTGAGSGLQSELGGKLAGIDAPGTAAGITGGVGATATGAANAGLATGDATLSQLLSEGANAKTYGAKLPAITALAGAQDVAKHQGQVTSDEKTQLADLESKVPGMVQSELASLASARTAAEKNRIAVALAENIDPNTGQLTEKGRAELKRLSIEQQNADTSATRASNAQSNADRSAAQRDESLGIQEKKLKLEIAKAIEVERQKGKLHGLTQNEYQTKASQALGLARVAHAPTSDGHPPVSWQQYLNGGLKQKVPIWVLIEQGKKVYSQDEIKIGLIPGSK